MTKPGYKTYSLRQQEAITGYVLIIPYLLGFIVFQGLPFVLTILTSVTNMRFISINPLDLEFVGIRNYIEVLQDKDFIMSFVRSMYYMVLYVPLVMIVSLLVAYFIDSGIFIKNIIRTLLFLPYIANIVAVAIVWVLLYDYNDGPINMFIRHLGIENPPMWLVGNFPIVIPSIVIVSVWNSMGLFFVTYLAALQGIPKEIYESADIDGANSVRKFFDITVPYLTPTTFFLFLTAVITSMQNFAVIQVLTGGGPGNESTTLSLYTYTQSFTYGRMQIGAAQSVLMLVVPLIITAVNWRGQKKWSV